MTAPATLANRSWADIVKGNSSPSETLPDTVPAETALTTGFAQSSAAVLTEEALPDVLECSAPLQPAARGSLQCLCHGQVLTMLSYYGWLKAFAVIDHPMFDEHFGRIYIKNCDVMDGHTLEEGDIVSFYLYVDDIGLGAEACRVEKKAAVESVVLRPEVVEASRMRADAVEFVPASASTRTLRADAVEFVPSGPSAVAPSITASTSAHCVADMFARMSRAIESVPANGCVQMFGINSAFFDDGESSEEGDTESVETDKESFREESDQGSSDSELPCQCNSHDLKHEELRLAAPWRKPFLKVGPEMSNSDENASDSTTAGVTSGSECENHKPIETMFAAPPGITLPKFRPPPGLSLPSVLEPPPGIFFPPGLEAFTISQATE